MRIPVEQHVGILVSPLAERHAVGEAYPSSGRITALAQRGMSLIELMVAITLGLIILSSLSTLFINQSKARTELDKSNRMIDNGRYTLEMLTENLRLAGYYGEFAPASGVPVVPLSMPDPCSNNASDIAAALQLPVQGYDAATVTSSIASPPCSLTYASGSLKTLKPGSDILVIRRASTATPVASAAAVSNTTYLQFSLCDTDPTPSYQLAKAPATFTTLHKKNCTDPADLRRFLVQVYFVSSNNNVGDGISTLKRLELDTNNTFSTTPLVEGIEFMQLEYAMDINGDGEIDGGYTDCSTCSPADWSNVVSVKINIVAKNTEPTAGQVDTKTYSLGAAGNYAPAGVDATYKRHAYTKVVRLVNPAGRREVP